MGLSSSKSKSSTTYNKAALPYINSATSAVQGAYNNNLGNVSDVTNALKTSFDNYNVTNPNLMAAGSYVGDVLGGKYLEGNPYLQGIIDDTNSSVTDQVNALFSKAGQTGSSRQIGELGKQLSSAENNLRYANYSDEQDRIANAISQAVGLNNSNNQNLATQLALGQGLTSIGTDAANSYAQAIANLWGNNTTTTTKSSPSLGQMLLSAANSAATAYGGWQIMAMMFRGLGKPTDQLDIQLAQASDPFGISTAGMGTSPYVPAPQAAPTKEKFGFRDVIGILGEALGGALGQGPGAYTQGKLMGAPDGPEVGGATGSAAGGLGRLGSSEAVERDNPAPINNDTVNDYNFYRTQLGEEGANRWLANQTDPVVSIPLPGGQTYIGPRSGLGAATKGGDRASVGNSAPQGAIDYLRANPSAAEQFDAKYGKGAAASILGGGGSNATGGFPRPY